MSQLLLTDQRVKRAGVYNNTDIENSLDSIPKRIRHLLTMLTYCRPSGSSTEKDFIDRFIVPTGATPDDYGNYWLEIGENNNIMWSCHTDTVHNNPGFQRIVYGDGIVTTEDGRNCLGADCTTGVWLMINMIKEKIPGIYIFHRAEEVGGLGSIYIEKNFKDRLKNVDFAIAFDRKGKKEIITHQFCSRTASNEFALSLSKALPGLDLAPSDGGTFTDTANYMGMISECTNISVGYCAQHTQLETQDCYYAIQLLDSIIAADFTQLVAKRDCTVDESFTGRSMYGHYSRNDFVDYASMYGSGDVSYRRNKDYKKTWDRHPSSVYIKKAEEVDPLKELEEYCFVNSDMVAQFLWDNGMTLEDLISYSFNTTGV